MSKDVSEIVRVTKKVNVIANKDVPRDVNYIDENVLETNVRTTVSHHNNMENDVSDLPENPIDYGDILSDDVHNDVSPDVNDNVEKHIYAAEEVVAS